MILLSLLTAFAFVALTAILVIAVLNALTFPRLRVPPPAAPPLIHPSADAPFVSVLIAARDQSHTIAATVRALRAQTYAPFEVVILDDRSGDGTHAIAEAAAGGDPRFRVLSGQPLLETWRAGNWARHQLSQAANGRVLVFADTDVQWTPDALRALVALMQTTQADLLTVWPTQQAVTRAERLLVPLTALAVIGCRPATLVHNGSYRSLAVANRQFLAFRRSAYNAVGGHIAVRVALADGMAFARLIKAKGLRLRLADGAGLITCRRYRRWREIRDGFANNILAGCGGSLPLLVLATAIFFVIFALPWLWLLLGWLAPDITGWPLAPLALAILGVAARGLTAWTTRQRLADALWMPVSALLLAAIVGHALLRHRGEDGTRSEKKMKFTKLL